MKIRQLAFLGILIVLTSCGGSKKATQIKGSEIRENTSKLGGNVPSIEEIPNPLEERVPHFKSDISLYIYQYKAVAKEEMGTYGIPASITLAQGILESQAGKSTLTRKSNNHFGIKCHGWEGEKVYHDDDLRDECFRKYKNPNYSFRDHSLFLTNRKRYSKLFDLAIDDYKGWSRGLKRAGYATDPAYPRKLIRIIERHELYKYDREMLKNIRKAPAEESIVENEQHNASNSHEKRIEKPYIVRKGDTLYSISKRFGLSVESLKKINNLHTNAISIGQELEVNRL